jgi:hypothetical protein
MGGMALEEHDLVEKALRPPITNASSVPRSADADDKVILLPRALQEKRGKKKGVRYRLLVAAVGKFNVRRRERGRGGEESACLPLPYLPPLACLNTLRTSLSIGDATT